MFKVARDKDRRIIGVNWSVYIILCTDSTFYTGITKNIDRRLLQHAGQGGAKYFRGRQPKYVVYLERGHSRSSASRREIAIKKMRRKEKCLLILSDRNEVELPEATFGLIG
ncbi:MAG: GIY-YIG nuclease family protein [Pseudomonadota bacterium]